MNDILSNYQWMIWIIVICIILLIVCIVLLLLNKNKKDEFNESDREQQKIINEYIKEEKKERINESKQEKIENEDEDMLFKKKKNTITTKTTTTTKTTKAPEKRTVNGKYEIFEVAGSYKYTLKASNGEKLVESELYSSKETVLSAIEAVKRNLETGKYSISEDKSKLFQFKLTASNNRPLAVSANYSSKQNAESALESFKRFAKNSPVVEVEAPKDALMEEITVVKGKLEVNGKITISKTNDKFVFELYANNGQLLCTSQPYTTKANCESGVETLKTNVNEGKFYVTKDKNSLYQFKLYTKAGRLVAMGQTYEDKQRAVSSANSVASFIDGAVLVK